jgi:hypothetical protein
MNSEGHVYRARSEGHARRARRIGIDDPTWRRGPDKRVPPKDEGHVCRERGS